MNRRDLIGAASTVALATAFGALSVAQGLTSAFAQVNPVGEVSMPMQSLIQTLLKTKLPVCEQVAAQLLRRAPPVGDFELHLRRAGLTPKDVNALCQVLSKFSHESVRRLISLSLSYNNQIGDESVAALLRVLPPTVTALGLVDCGLGDRAGRALVSTLQFGSALNTVCVEGNHFSAGLRDRLRIAASRHSVSIFL